MNARTALRWVLANESLNFVLTNRLPRRALTLLMARFSKIEQPWVRDCSIGLWQVLSDLDLSNARKQRFASLHDCFIRELREGARPINPDPRAIVSPCDAIIGATGCVQQGLAIQAKDSSYPVEELLGDRDAAVRFEGCTFVTLRLTATMYHRFHAPEDCVLERVRYFSGDTWNVNPPALRRVAKLFCRNERVSLECRLSSTGQLMTLVPVAAILVASIRLHCLNVLLHMRYSGTPVFEPNAQFCRGQEIGWFEHGSTIILFGPRGYALDPSLSQGAKILMGQTLLRRA